MISAYVTSLRNAGSTTPIAIDENGAISIFASYLGKEIESFDELKTGSFPGIFLYEIPEEKQHFDIITVRKCIADMSLEPYEGKSIAILRGFHTATIEAQNGLLKLLEDCPSYGAIILVVDDIESLLDTVRSRIVSLCTRNAGFQLSSDIRTWMDEFFAGSIDNFMRYLFVASYKKEEAIAILRYAIQLGNMNQASLYEKGIIDIFSTNENPRNILDSIFIIPVQV